jgi:phosphatidylglycerophosphate synthase
MTISDRRPIQARSSNWAKSIAAGLARSNVTPNQISVASAIVASAGAAFLLAGPSTTTLLACAACIQLRLLCNLLDGMVAIEGGRQSALGSMYNEFPDRIADSVLIVALGYAVNLPWLGWLGALAAALTAYIRLFGPTQGLAQDFRGPMAKQHRMAVMTIGCIAAAIETAFHASQWSLLAALSLIAAGGVLTCFTRTLAIARQLETR